MHVELLSETVVPGCRLGRHVHHDPRSRDFPAIELVTPGHALHDQEWPVPGTVLNQGDLGSCTGNATTHLLRAVRRQSAGLAEHAAVSIYELATTLDAAPGQYPPDDTGSDGLSALKAAQQLGMFTGTYRWCFGAADVLAVLAGHGPVIVGIPWYAGFDTPAPDGLCSIAGDVRGGHEVCVYGLDWTNRRVDVVNSWGRHWGLHGRFSWTIDTLERLLHEHGDAATIGTSK